MCSQSPTNSFTGIHLAQQFMLAREGGGVAHQQRDEAMAAPALPATEPMNVIDMIIAMVLERTDLFATPDHEARYQAHARTHVR